MSMNKCFILVWCNTHFFFLLFFFNSPSASGELLPTIANAIQKEDWNEARFQILRTAQLVHSVSEMLQGKLAGA